MLEGNSQNYCRSIWENARQRTQSARDLVRLGCDCFLFSVPQQHGSFCAFRDEEDHVGSLFLRLGKDAWIELKAPRFILVRINIVFEWLRCSAPTLSEPVSQWWLWFDNDLGCCIAVQVRLLMSNVFSLRWSWCPKHLFYLYFCCIESRRLCVLFRYFFASVSLCNFLTISVSPRTFSLRHIASQFMFNVCGFPHSNEDVPRVVGWSWIGSPAD